MLDYFPQRQMLSTMTTPVPHHMPQDQDMGKAVDPSIRSIQEKKTNLSKHDQLSACPKPDHELEMAAMPDFASSSRSQWPPFLLIPAAGTIFALSWVLWLYGRVKLNNTLSRHGRHLTHMQWKNTLPFRHHPCSSLLPSSPFHARSPTEALYLTRFY